MLSAKIGVCAHTIQLLSHCSFIYIDVDDDDDEENFTYETVSLHLFRRQEGRRWYTTIMTEMIEGIRKLDCFLSI